MEYKCLKAEDHRQGCDSHLPKVVQEAAIAVIQKKLGNVGQYGRQHDGMKKPPCALASHAKHSQEQAQVTDIPSQVGRKPGYIGIGVHYEHIDRPVVFAQEFRQEKTNEQPEAPLGDFDVFEHTIQQPHDGT